MTWPATPAKDARSSPKSASRAESEATDNDDTVELLRHYLSLKLDLQSLYEQWSQADPNFRKKAPSFTGVRILSQDPWEALIGFICSSNNNISRISQMVCRSKTSLDLFPCSHTRQVHKLCQHYGPLIGHVHDEPFHDFPSPEALTGPKVESHLRELGFGYRARYIAETARLVANERPKGWLESLANPEHPSYQSSQESDSGSEATYKEAHEQLLELAGVGPKVADCVCLMGLGWGEAVPVDTHVWQIAQRDYKFGKVKTKTFNKVMYDAVGDHFRGLWGSYAGWAHSVLFTADLKSFSEQSVKKEEVLEEGGVKIKREVEVEEIVESRKRTRVVKRVMKVEVEDNMAAGVVIEVNPHKRRRR